MYKDPTRVSVLLPARGVSVTTPPKGIGFCIFIIYEMTYSGTDN